MNKFDFECPKCHAHRSVETVGKVMEVKCLACNKPMKPVELKGVQLNEDDFEQTTLFNLKWYELGG